MSEWKELFDLSNLDNPGRCWAVSDHMIFYLILLPICIAVAMVVLPIMIILQPTGIWDDDYDL